MKYISPVVEINEFSTEDVVMISGLEVQESGTLTETSWDDLG